MGCIQERWGTTNREGEAPQREKGAAGGDMIGSGRCQ